MLTWLVTDTRTGEGYFVTGQYSQINARLAISSKYNLPVESLTAEVVF